MNIQVFVISKSDKTKEHTNINECTQTIVISDFTVNRL